MYNNSEINFWARQYWGNSLQVWATALIILVVGIAMLYLLKRFLINRLRKLSAATNTQFDDALVTIINGPALYLLYLILFRVSMHTLVLGTRVTRLLHVAFTLGFTILGVWMLTSFLRSLLFNYLKRKDGAITRFSQARGLLFTINAIIWMLAIVFAINNLGYNVTAIITGLGVGGIAIALAAQAVLADLFSYFVIFFDRPFEVGDFIVTADKMGTVESIGIKTTRLRTLSGEQLVCSNTFLTNSQVHNYKRMQTRRVVFTLSIKYDTPVEQVKQIPVMVRSIVESTADVTFDRGNFMELAGTALKFEFVYYIQSADYNVYMNKQEEILLQILSQFRTADIRFAFPTQTLYLNNEANAKTA